MPTIDELRNQFDGLTINDKYEYVTQLKEYVEKKGGPEHREFLTECVHKYNAEVQRMQQHGGDSNTHNQNPPRTEPSESAPQRQPEHNQSKPQAEQPEHGRPDTPQREPSPAKGVEREPGRSGRNAGRIAEKPAGGIGNVLTAIPKPIIISVVAVVVVGVTVLTLWLTGLLPWGRNADTPGDEPTIEDVGSGDVLTDEIETPDTNTIVLSRLTDGGAMSDEESYAEAFEKIRNAVNNRFEGDGWEYSFLWEVESFSDVTYAFHDIDGNGIKELIFAFKGYTSAIFSRSGGEVFEIYRLESAGDVFLEGINELGYVVVGGSSGASSYEMYSKITEDGLGITDTEFVQEGDWDSSSYTFSIIEQGVSRVVDEAEFVDTKSGMIAPFVELDWNALTATTGISNAEVEAMLMLEAAYAEAFEDFRRRFDESDGGLLESMSNADITDISYSLYDIDKNGISELIISNLGRGGFGNWGVMIYTLSNGEVVQLNHIQAYRGGFNGINELGYICSGYAMMTNAGEAYGFSVIADDGISLLDLSAIRENHYDGNDFVGDSELATFTISTPDGKREVTEVEFNEYVDSMRAVPMVELDWQPLTETTGTVEIDTPQPIIATPGIVSVSMDGKETECEAFEVNGNDYFKLRDIAEMLSGTDYQFDISYDSATDELMLITGSSYTPIGGELTQSGEAQTAIPAEWGTTFNGIEHQFLSFIIADEYYFSIDDLTKLMLIPNEISIGKAEQEEQPKEDDVLSAVYRAYYDLLTGKIDELGLGWENSKGVFYTELLDFDNNGIPELLIGWDNGMNIVEGGGGYSPAVSVYGYLDGVTLLFEAGLVGGGDMDQYNVEIAENENGQYYFVRIDGHPGELNYRYYIIRDNAWTLVLSTYRERQENSAIWRVNGTEYSDNDYNAYLRTDFGIINTRRDVYWIDDFTGDGNEGPVYDINTVHTVLAELEG